MSSSALSLPLPPAAASTLPRSAAAAQGPAVAAPRQPPFGHHPDLARGERRWLVAGVAGLHLLLLWGLLQMGAVRQTLREVAPLMVDFISLEAPPQPAPPPPPPPAQRPQPVRSTPLPVVVAAPTPQAPPTPTAFVAPEPVAAPVQAVPTPTPPAPAAPVTATAAVPAPTPTPTPAPKPVAASALRYAVLPPIELPLASRRLGESGTVLLRVVFDTQGRVKQASVHRSSGYARLDEQALAAMRQARITPFLDNGIAIEVSAIAPLAYELD